MVTKSSAIAGSKILVVEDETAISFLISESLRDWGADPLPVEDGRAALSIIDTWAPDAILLDIMLPKVDGYGVVSALRSACRRSGLPLPRIVVMTAGWRAHDIAKELKVDVWLSKPFLLDELRDSIERVLENPPPPVD